MTNLYSDEFFSESKLIKSLIKSSFLIFILGIATAFGIGINDSGWWQIPLYLSSAFSFFRVWKKFPWPDNLAPYLSFGGILLISSAVRRLFYLGDFLIFGERFSEWPLYTANPAWDTFTAEVIIVVGTFITLLCWSIPKAYTASFEPAMSFSKNKFRRFNYLIYLSSLAALFLSFIFIGQFGYVLETLGLASSYFIASSLKSTLKKISLSTFLTIPYIIASLASGMKANAILAFTPIILITFTSLRAAYQRFIVIFLLAALLILNSGLSNYIRSTYWTTKTDVNQLTILSEYFEYLRTVNINDFFHKELEFFLFRANSSYNYGFAISVVRNKGYYTDLVFEPLFYAFVPRILWKGKPLIDSSSEYNYVVFGRRTSSMESGFFTGLFLGAGWLGLMVGSAFIGFIIAYLSRLAAKYGGSVCQLMFSFALIPVALRFPERWPSPAIAGVVIVFVYTFISVKIFSSVIGKSFENANNH
jgi:hypothetical protein